MKITKDVISDLFPLYVTDACSPDTRLLVEEYLRTNPDQAQDLRRISSTTVPKPPLNPASLDEVRSLREARRRVRRRSWLLALAIFFSLTPFSFLATGGRVYWLFREAPQSAIVYGSLGVACWVAYAIVRNRSRTL